MFVLDIAFGVCILSVETGQIRILSEASSLSTHGLSQIMGMTLIILLQSYLKGIACTAKNAAE